MEATLWEAADKLRGNLEAAKHKHVVLGLVFLTYVSDAFVARRTALEAALSNPEGRTTSRPLRVGSGSSN